MNRRLLSPVLAAVLLVEIGLPAAARADGSETRVQTVEDLANQAYTKVSQGKYAEAVAAYMKAYEISKTAAILYNIATIYDRKLHERALAVEYFRRYLEATDLDPEFARKATERLSTLKAELAAEERTRSALPAVPATPGPSSPAGGDAGTSSGGSALRPVGVVFGSVGLASMATSLALGVLAKSKYNQANDSCGSQWCSSSQGVTLDQQAHTFATASTATFVAGAVLFVTGVTLFVAAPRARNASASVAVAPEVGPSSGGLSVLGTF
jgi:tetratricopeptide (TPR) repeat protein